MKAAICLVMTAFLGAVCCSPGNGRSVPLPLNALPIAVNAGPPGAGYVNGLFASVTLCVPGTTTCQTIDSVLVDTGSIGLRVLSSNAGGELTLALPQSEDESGDPIVECNAFVDGYTWGPLRMADVQMGSEEARSVPIQVIGDPAFAAVPASCSAGGGVGENTLQDLGTYAILGVGPLPQDCGSACADSLTAEKTDNPGNVYYVCPPSGCQPAAVAVDAQVQNPVSLLPTDNNGVVVDLSAVSAGGAPSVSGSLVFGIGTQPNNGLGSAAVLPIDPETLTFTTVYQGQPYAMSFIDSGSNALYFLDPAATSLPTCTDEPADTFYCPETTGTVSFTATNEGTNGESSVVGFGVANTDMLFDDDDNVAFNDLAGTSGSSQYFDWGVPFFFGRKVFSAIEGAVAPGGQTPYFAY
jgi:Protein of unknown function (DUF3443)